MNSVFNVRPATPADAAGAAACQAGGFQTAYRGILPDAKLDDPRLVEGFVHARREKYARQEAIHLVRTSRASDRASEAIAGFCDVGPLRAYSFLPALGPVGRTLELWALYVHPRGEGSGRALVRAGIAAALGRFPACDARVVVLTLAGNAGGRGFYEKLGGTLADVYPGYPLWGETYPVACYRWDPARLLGDL